MSQIYSNPKRESEPMLCDGCNVREPWAHRCFGAKSGCTCGECREADKLFPVKPEVFYHDAIAMRFGQTGWFWQLPDGEPNGPFDTEQEAIADAQSDGSEDDDDNAWSGRECDVTPSECWIDDVTGEHVNATTNERTPDHRLRGVES